MKNVLSCMKLNLFSLCVTKASANPMHLLAKHSQDNSLLEGGIKYDYDPPTM